jgi:hypothetical protein
MTDNPLTSRQELAVWWWGLTEPERAAIRRQFIEKLDTDPVFLSQVRKLLHDEQTRVEEHT